MTDSTHVLAPTGRITRVYRDLTAAADSGGRVRWEGELMFLDTPTSDRRIYTAAGFSHDELPLPLFAMFEDDHGSGADLKSVLVGQISSLSVDGKTVKMSGTFRDDEDGQRGLSVVESEDMPGISADPFPKRWITTYPGLSAEEAQQVVEEMTAEESGDEASLLQSLQKSVVVEESIEQMPQRTFVEYVVRGATLVPFPAFDPEPRIAVVAEPAVAASAEPRTVVSVLGGDREGLAFSVTDGDLARSVMRDFASERDPVEGVEALRLLVEMYDALRLAGGDPEADGTMVERIKVGDTEFPLAAEALTASAAGLAPVEPPLAWFHVPEPDELTPLTVTAEGQVYGHAAAWDVCHIGHDGCVTAPHSASGYAYFHLGSVRTAEGDDVACGQITLGTGHANLNAGRQAAAEHYDNTGTAAADVVAQDGQHGIWVCGALRSDTPAERVRTLSAAKLSGDWRSVNGRLEMVGLLAVVVPGFPVPRVMSRAASGEPQRVAMVAAGQISLAPTVRLDAAGRERRARVLAARAREGAAGLVALARG